MSVVMVDKEEVRNLPRVFIHIGLIAVQNPSLLQARPAKTRNVKLRVVEDLLGKTWFVDLQLLLLKLGQLGKFFCVAQSEYLY